MPIYAFFRSNTTCTLFFNVLMHVDVFSVMYTSQGSGDILVRMCGSWEKMMVDQRKCKPILKQVKQCVVPIYAFLRSNTTCTLFLMF